LPFVQVWDSRQAQESCCGYAQIVGARQSELAKDHGEMAKLRLDNKHVQDGECKLRLTEKRHLKTSPKLPFCLNLIKPWMNLLLKTMHQFQAMLFY